MVNLSPLVFKTNFFEKIQERNQNIKAKDLDNQFNIVTNYINNFLIVALDELIKQTLPGTLDPTKKAANLVNVGNKTTKWDFPNSNYLLDESLNLTKLKKLNLGSIIITDQNSVFTEITPTSPGLAVISRLNQNLMWKKIGNSSIQNRAITEKKIAKNTLTKNKFGFNIAKKRIKKIFNNYIIKDHSIYGGNNDVMPLAQNAIEQKHFDPISLAKLITLTTSDMIKEGSIRVATSNSDYTPKKNIKFKRHSIDFKKIDPNLIITGDYIFPSYDALADNAITSRHISDQSVFLFFYDHYFQNGYLNQTELQSLIQYFKPGCIGAKQLPIEYQRKLELL